MGGMAVPFGVITVKRVVTFTGRDAWAGAGGGAGGESEYWTSNTNKLPLRSITEVLGPYDGRATPNWPGGNRMIPLGTPDWAAAVVAAEKTIKDRIRSCMLTSHFDPHVNV